MEGMPEVRLLPSRKCSGYFATKRFDRIGAKEGAVQKVHMVSVGALLETSHRIPNLDYDLLMRLVLRLTGDMGEVEQMFLRMVFNVLCGNRDDHSKNTSFVYGGRGESCAVDEMGCRILFGLQLAFVSCVRYYAEPGHERGACHDGKWKRERHRRKRYAFGCTARRHFKGACERNDLYGEIGAFGLMQCAFAL